jgi:hypothetical protein
MAQEEQKALQPHGKTQYSTSSLRHILHRLDFPPVPEVAGLSSGGDAAVATGGSRKEPCCSFHEATALGAPDLDLACIAVLGAAGVLERSEFWRVQWQTRIIAESLQKNRKTPRRATMLRGYRVSMQLCCSSAVEA